MQGFERTDQRLRTIAGRMEGFALEPMRIVRMTYYLQKLLRDRLNAALKSHDLIDTSFIVLAVLYGSPGETSTASELAEACHEKPANLTRVCDELAANGLIARNPKPGDRRAVMISLTGPGRELIEQALPEASGAIVPGFVGLSDAEMQQFAELYGRVLRNLGSQG